MKRYVFDSYAMIAFFEDEPGAEIVERALKELAAKQAVGWMSVINWGEVYYCTYRQQGRETAVQILQQIAAYSVEIVPADRALTLDAVQIKARHKIAYADCFAAALARKKNAPLITGDHEFSALEDELDILWLR